MLFLPLGWPLTKMSNPPQSSIKRQRPELEATALTRGLIHAFILVLNPAVQLKN